MIYGKYHGMVISRVNNSREGEYLTLNRPL